MDVGCQRAIAPRGEFMAGGSGVDACFGDSGGPVYLETADGPALIGVVSRGMSVAGVPCGNGGIYVRADKVVSWVQSVTGARLERSAGCDQDSPADGEGGVDPGGCATSGGAGMGVGIVLALLAWRRKRVSHCRSVPI
jgi:MYXO-CTERM domain-containing protein